MTRVAVNPDLFHWARERSRIDSLVLVSRFPKLPAWENAEAQPTLKQLEDYARATHATSRRRGDLASSYQPTMRC